jgi:hypothetical protein
VGSGPKSVEINPSERAVSIDINRLQQLIAQFQSEDARAIEDTLLGTDDLDGGSIETENTTQLTPDSALILSGLRVVPAVGSLNLTVTPGIIHMLDPDATPDPSDSPYKEINDAGIPSSGIISMTGNSSGSTRIDVIECARVAAPGYQVFETDNRDIYNNATQLFSPQTVNKVIGGALMYRVRQGTPGSGFPGSALGWVPLMVASVPNGSTTNDTMDFWDVRPMASDRIFPPYRLGSDYPRWHHANYFVSTSVVANKALLVGTVDASGSDLITPSPGFRRLGGRLRTSGISVDFPVAATYDGLDLNDSNNWSSTLTTGLAYLYLLENLYGLPRWMRCTKASTGNRLPRSPRGFLVVSPTVPNSFYGTPSAVIGVPASTGLGSGTTAKGICLGVLNYSSGKAGETICDGRTQWNSNAYPQLNGSLAGNGTTTVTATFQFFEGTNYLPGAKAIWIDVQWAFSVAAAAFVGITGVVNDLNGNPMVTAFADTFTAAVVGSPYNGYGRRYRIPIPIAYANSAVIPGSYPGWQLVITFGAGGNMTSELTPNLNVVGWDLY